MNKTSTFLTVSGLAVASALGALMLMSPPAQSSRERERERDETDGRSDATFYEQALRSGASAAAASRMAHQRSSNEEVLQLAVQMERDHTSINRRLAAAGGIRVPQLDAEQRALQDRLRELSGTGFDEVWLRHMQRSHARSIALYERAVRGAASAETRELAESILPTLHSHIDRVEGLLSPHLMDADSGAMAVGAPEMEDDSDGDESDTATKRQDDAATAAGQGMGAGLVVDEANVADTRTGPWRSDEVPDGGAG